MVDRLLMFTQHSIIFAVDKTKVPNSFGKLDKRAMSNNKTGNATLWARNNSRAASIGKYHPDCVINRSAGLHQNAGHHSHPGM